MRTILLALAATVVATASARATTVLDQSFLNKNGNAAVFPGATDIQTFTVGQTGTLSTVDLYYYGAGDITLDVFPTVSGVPSQYLLAQGDEISRSGSEVVYNMSLPVTAGEVLALDYINSSPYPAYLDISYDGFSGYENYTGGQLFFQSNFSDGLTGDSAFGKVDADFQTYVTIPGGSVVSAAPEPGAWALMLGGIGIIGGLLRLSKACRFERRVCGLATA